FLMISQSNVSRGSAISSRSREIGRISSSANLRAVICQARCSLLSVKSMGFPFSSLGRQHRGARRPTVACQRLRDAPFRFAAPHSGMEADARTLNVFLERNVSHHSHGAEAFRRILYGAVDRLGGEYGGDDGERQIRETAVGKGIGVIRRPRGLPNGSARDFEADRDLGELCADRLMVDEWPPALHA